MATYATYFSPDYLTVTYNKVTRTIADHDEIPLIRLLDEIIQERIESGTATLNLTNRFNLIRAHNLLIYLCWKTLTIQHDNDE